MLELLTGTGLAAAAGMNAYVPLLVVGLVARLLPDVLALPEGWSWLASWWAIGALAVLLVVEVVADKVPAVDSMNDVLQTAVRPTAGGLAFGSTSGASTAAVADPSELFASQQWVPVVLGVAIALAVHLAKSALRPAANLATAGAAAPVASTAEDLGAVALSVLALVAPVLVLLVLGLLGALAWRIVRVARRRRAAGRPGTA
ncbi:DUF4126 domain-containing protein [Agrococcus sp. SL85]|uniref:DUF4126 domain-containing protein n=1 Tax=Agrococcus sp. SL85 TaxID=2995141 RepID=UPI00226CCACF|nr:DUF4126 domain-containing protein [Agrococcus sp. SL85]WAC65875.1 DUF4126 domain-containing protein [Agrococcus sp. SL85]